MNPEGKVSKITNFLKNVVCYPKRIYTRLFVEFCFDFPVN